MKYIAGWVEYGFIADCFLTTFTCPSKSKINKTKYGFSNELFRPTNTPKNHFWDDSLTSLGIKFTRT